MVIDLFRFAGQGKAVLRKIENITLKISEKGEKGAEE